MDDWDKFTETSLTQKEGFYRHLNMEDITDADYAPAKRFWNKKFIRILWFIRSKRYIIVSLCIWELLKYGSWNIWAWSCTKTFQLLN